MPFFLPIYADCFISYRDHCLPAQKIIDVVGDWFICEQSCKVDWRDKIRQWLSNSAWLLQKLIKIHKIGSGLNPQRPLLARTLLSIFLEMEKCCTWHRVASSHHCCFHQGTRKLYLVMGHGLKNIFFLQCMCRQPSVFPVGSLVEKSVTLRKEVLTTLCFIPCFLLLLYNNSLIQMCWSGLHFPSLWWLCNSWGLQKRGMRSERERNRARDRESSILIVCMCVCRRRELVLRGSVCKGLSIHMLEASVHS